MINSSHASRSWDFQRERNTPPGIVEGVVGIALMVGMVEMILKLISRRPGQDGSRKKEKRSIVIQVLEYKYRTGIC